MAKINLKNSKGFTLMEVMIITAILGVLIIAFLVSMLKQRTKAEDAKMKDDLYRLRIAFEEYYNDNNCYPPAEWFDGQEDCNSRNLAPYLGSIPCNKKTGLPYVIEYDATACSSFKIFTKLANPNDPDVQELIVEDGSGDVDCADYNYGVSSTNETVTINCVEASPSPSPYVQHYYCQGVSNCTSFNPTLETCTPSWTNDPECGRTPSTLCPAGDVGTCNPVP